MNRSLRKLARLCGVSLCYRDMNSKLIFAKPLAVTKLLEAILNQDLSTSKKIISVLKAVETQKSEQFLPPVLVAWDGKLKSVFATVRESEGPCEILWSPKQRWKLVFAGETPKSRTFRRHKESYTRVQLPLNLVLPFGYHTLNFKISRREHSVLVISAPGRLSNKNSNTRRVGVFTPLYALRSNANCGIGDLADLKLVMSWISKSGGHFISTLPLLPIDYAKSPIDPSPYSAVSRLFLNEIYLPVESTQEINSSEHVDYKATYLLKKEALLKKSKAFFSNEEDKGKDYLAFIRDDPEVLDYSRYRSRSKTEQQFHNYCQFSLQQRMKQLKKAKLFLDLPVGVARHSFDVKHYPLAFLKGVSAGAPPDPMFRSGQNWGFYPSHPLRARAEHYVYFRRVLKKHFAHAKMLRIDHMAGMHRIFAIPDFGHANDGAYIRYKADELYALIVLEAHLKKAAVIGEDLGVVPSAVQEKMKRHGISGMWVFEYMTWQAPKKALAQIPKDSLRLVSTHDTPPLFGFYQGVDIEILRERGFFNEKEEDKQIAKRKRELQKWMRHVLKKHQHHFVDDAFLKALLMQLCAPSTALMQINLEDLWLESDPQNVPGTSKEYPNWSKKHRYAMEEWMKSKSISHLIRSLAHGK